MRRIGIWVPALVAGLLAVACGMAATTGGKEGAASLRTGVTVRGLRATEAATVTWKLYVQRTDTQTYWDLVDSGSREGAPGQELFEWLATCEAGEPFLVQFTLAEVVDSGTGGIEEPNFTATAGGQEVICVDRSDTPVRAVIQYRHSAGLAGADPALEIQQVCASYKRDACSGEPQSGLTAIWVQNPHCNDQAGEASTLCMLPSCPSGTCGVEIEQVQNNSGGPLGPMNPLRAVWSTLSGAVDLDYLLFPANLDASKLYLIQHPWRLRVACAGNNPDQDLMVASWYYDTGLVSGIAAGSVKVQDENAYFVWGAGDVLCNPASGNEGDSLSMVNSGSADFGICDDVNDTIPTALGVVPRSASPAGAPPGFCADPAKCFDIMLSCPNGGGDIRTKAVTCDVSFGKVDPGNNDTPCIGWPTAAW